MMYGGAAASHHQCQNQPDPDHPPGSPVHHQAHVDSKIGAAIRGGQAGAWGWVGGEFKRVRWEGCKRGYIRC